MTTTQTTDEYWSKLYDNGRDFSLITSEALTGILSYVEGDTTKTCLDIGCGTGQLMRELYHRGYKCIGIDASKSGVKMAQSLTTVPQDAMLYQQFDIEHDPLRDLPEFNNVCYSLITCKLVFAFIENRGRFIERIKSLLAPGGIFVVITPHVDDVPAERQGIAVDDTALRLLAENFTQVALYKDKNLQGTLTYFIGRA